MIKMAFTKEQIEHYHDIGLMPDWAYYQQNDASPQENYDRQKAKIRQSIIDKLQEEQQQKEIEKQMERKVEDILEDLLSGLDFDIVLK